MKAADLHVPMPEFIREREQRSGSEALPTKATNPLCGMLSITAAEEWCESLDLLAKKTHAPGC